MSKVSYAYDGQVTIRFYGTRSDLVAAGCPDEWFKDCLRRPDQKWGMAHVPREVHGLTPGPYIETKLRRKNDTAEVEFTVQKKEFAYSHLPSWAKRIVQMQMEAEELRKSQCILQEENRRRELEYWDRGGTAFVKFMACLLTRDARFLMEGPRRPDATA